MYKLNQIEFLVETDRSAIYVRDTTDYSQGSGAYSFDKFQLGNRVIRVTLPDNSKISFSNSNVAEFTGCVTDPSIAITTFNNKSFTYWFNSVNLNTDPSGAPLPIGNYKVEIISYPAFDPTSSQRVGLMYKDIAAYNVFPDSVLFLALVPNPIANDTTQIAVIQNTNPEFQSSIDYFGSSASISVGVVNPSSIIEPNQVAALVELDCEAKKIYLTDRTTYDTSGAEAAYEIDNYTSLTKLIVTFPSGTEYVFGDTPPALGGWYRVPVSFTEDGLYILNFINIPVQLAGYTYQVGDCYTNQDGSIIYTLTDTGVEEILLSEVPLRFSVSYPVVVLCESITCEDTNFYKSFCFDTNCLKDICKSPAFNKVIKSTIVMLDLEVGYTDDDKLTSEYKDKVERNISILKQMCAC